jgi:hypothetical protein
MESSNQVLDEFDTNLKLLKSAYKVYHRELNRDTIIYSCNLEDKDRQLVTQANQRASTQESKSKDEHDDLFAEVQNHHT